MTSHFSCLESTPPIEVWRLTELYNADTNTNKVNLGIGVYQDEEGKIETLPVVKSTEKQLSKAVSPNKMYLEHVGLKSYRDTGLKVVLGEQSPCIQEQRAVSIQSLGGTGALRIGFEFLYQNGYTRVYLPAPTWPNHKAILKAIDIEVFEYRYWDDKRLNIDMAGLFEDLSAAPANSVILLHACAHNPTGMDPTQEQWMQIGRIIQQKNHIAFFDLAYQGLSSGDLDQDAWAIRHFAHDLGLEIFVAQSFSKNFAMYSERVGQLIAVFQDNSIISAFQSQVTAIIWSLYLTPPEHGAKIIATVLSSQKLTNQWKSEVKGMFNRIKSIRQKLYNRLLELNTPGDWEHIVKQTGMFAYTGLKASQCTELVNHHSCYLTMNGRINVCAISPKNVDYVAEQIHQVVAASWKPLNLGLAVQYFNGEEFERRRRGSRLSIC